MGSTHLAAAEQGVVHHWPSPSVLSGRHHATTHGLLYATSRTAMEKHERRTRRQAQLQLCIVQSATLPPIDTASVSVTRVDSRVNRPFASLQGFRSAIVQDIPISQPLTRSEVAELQASVDLVQALPKVPACSPLVALTWPLARSEAAVLQASVDLIQALPMAAINRPPWYS